MTKWICKQCRSIKDTHTHVQPDHIHDWHCLESKQRDAVLMREVTTPNYNLQLGPCKENCEKLKLDKPNGSDQTTFRG